jgi:tryptophanyl-tRNA synthetase
VFPTRAYDCPLMARVLSGIQPSGDLHLGNYLGAIRNWVEDQGGHDAFYCVVDLHALTLDIDPAELRARTYDTALDLLAAGLDPERCTLFVQSHVVQHSQMAWLLECTATMGELQRMTQFKEKTAGQESVRVGLFTYPVLQAADIVLYDADRVPVGDDQRQHLELARDVAIRFNRRFGDVLVVPTATIPTTGARVMDLQHPERKMSKSVSSPLGTVLILDDPAEITRKVKKAVTDTDGEVRYDPEHKPGLSNLLELLAVATGRKPAEVAAGYTRYGDLKTDTAEALVELLRPLQARRTELAADPGAVPALLARGAAKAREVAAATYDRAAEAVGLLGPA